jgi:hypothetical protein
MSTCSHTREDRLLAKQGFDPEVRGGVEQLLERYRDTLQPFEQDLDDWLEQASDEDLESLESIRTEISQRTVDRRAEFQTVFSEGAQNGAEAGRAVAARRYNLSIAFNVVPEETLNVLDDWVDVAADNTLDTITENSARWLRGAHKEGLSVDEIAENVDELYEGRLEDHVARRAARTGVNSSARAGHHSAHKDAGGVVAERWVSELRENTREDHENAHGQVVAVGKSFEVGGVYMDHPGDPGAPAGQIANCLCRAEPLFEDELTEEQLTAIEGGARIYI